MRAAAAAMGAAIGAARAAAAATRAGRRWNGDLAGLVAYLGFVVLCTLVHAPAALTALLAVALLAAGRDWRAVASRALRAALPFTALVALPWLAVHGLDAGAPYVLRLGLRVAAIAVAGFACIGRIDLLRAVRGAPTLAWMLALVTSQILVLRRAAADFAGAFESRCIARPSVRDRLRHATAMAGYLIVVALRQCEEVALAMRSRGFFERGPR